VSNIVKLTKRLFGAQSPTSVVIGYEHEIKSLLRRLLIDLHHMAKALEKYKRKELKMAKKKAAKKPAKKSAKKK